MFPGPESGQSWRGIAAADADADISAREGVRLVAVVTVGQSRANTLSAGVNPGCRTPVWFAVAIQMPGRVPERERVSSG